MSVALSQQETATKVTRSRSWFQWEYWPFNLLYAPILPYWIWLSLKTRSFFFFTSANPGIEFGGMLGESKEKILRSLAPEHIPVTVKLSKGINASEVEQIMQSAGLTYPVILKPDIGERGWGVEKIDDLKSLEAYLTKEVPSLLLQEFVDLSLELGVFYHRMPGKSKGKVTSIVKKQFLKVIGDGKSTVRILMEQDDRAKRYIKDFEVRSDIPLDNIPAFGENVALMPIGNHSRGTAFLNANDQIDENLNKVFDQVSDAMEGFYFGRFDLRCSSFEELKQGQNFKIMELNGAGAEPGHIYHPGSSLISAYHDIIYHLDLLADISIANIKRGIRPMSTSEGLKFLKGIRLYNRTYKQ
ncbi:MAG: hypothetical protein AAGC88_11695 [Bacteroidota bacterium]